MSGTRILAPEPGVDTLKHRPWGGSRLAELRRAPPGVERPIGESWEFSTLEGSESRCEGQPLGERLGRPLPFLAKLIDTAHPLSIQVHPADDPSGDPKGKEEAWIVLDADPGATLWAGLVPGTPMERLERAVADANEDATRGPGLVGLLEEIPVARGTVILVPAGTVHAIGGGITLAEIQQPTDCTYRLFDYGSRREIHPEQALAHTRLDAAPPTWRVGDAPTRLVGRHLELLPIGPGSHDFEHGEDVLIVAVQGMTSLSAGPQTADAPPGALRLCLPGPLRVTVPPGGLAVLGRIHAG